MMPVTTSSIDKRIDTVNYCRIPGTTVTICHIKMVNGFVVTGESACISFNDYDKSVGESIAYENAYEKLWQLEGYLQSERRYHDECLEEHCHVDSIEEFSIADKVRWLFGRPINQFNAFGLIVATECWYALEGNADNINTMNAGLRDCVTGLFDLMHRKEP